MSLPMLSGILPNKSPFVNAHFQVSTIDSNMSGVSPNKGFKVNSYNHTHIITHISILVGKILL